MKRIHFPLPSHLFLNLKLKYKLLLSYFVLISLPLGILTTLSYQSVSKAMEEKMIYSATQAFEQTDSFLSYELTNIVSVSDALATDKTVNEILRKEKQTYEIPQQIADASYLTRFFSGFQKKDDVFKIRLYVSDRVMYSEEKKNLFNFEAAKYEQWYKKLEASKAKLLWYPSSYFEESGSDGEKIIAVVRFVRNEENYRENIGILRIDVLESRIRDITLKANTTQNGVAFLINSEGAIVAASNDTLAKKWSSILDMENPALKDEMKYEKFNAGGQKILINTKKVKTTDWTLVSIIPMDEILSVSAIIRDQMFILMTLLCIVAFIAAFFIAYTITKRISLLNNTISMVQEGNTAISLSTNNTDEIGDLIRNFNFMVNKIEALIKEQYKIGQEAKGAELRALQAQINPHFLYNTLDMINWIAKKNKVPEISNIVEDLANFYKLSLNRGKDIVSIRDEISHIEYYLKIQNKRYENRILLALDIDTEVFFCSIPKIILQPLVENAIQHGILAKQTKSGKIAISGKIADARLLLKVSDDGVGMPEEVLQRIFEIKRNDKSGYGVKNINDRLKLYYGAEYGLFYHSSPGRGTTVEIFIPNIKYIE